jgi:hypothetical protein
MWTKAMGLYVWLWCQAGEAETCGVCPCCWAEGRQVGLNGWKDVYGCECECDAGRWLGRR